MAAKKSSLVGNINKRKRAGKSRSKKASTVSKEAYADMQHGWPGSKKKSTAKKKAGAKKKASAKKKSGAKKSAAKKKSGAKKRSSR